MKKQFRLIALLIAIVMVLASCTAPLPEADDATTESSSVSNQESQEATNESNVESSEPNTHESSDEDSATAESTEESESQVEETKAFVHDISHARSIEEIEGEIYITDEDFSEAESLLHVFESAGLESGAEYESVDALYLEFENKFNAIDTQISLATIVYYYDMSNEAASTRYLDVYGKFGDLYNAYIETCKVLYKESPLSAELFADWTEEDIEYLFDYDPRTQEIRDRVLHL